MPAGATIRRHTSRMMDLSAFHNQFREETTENVRALSDGLLAIEQAPDAAARRAILDRVFRAVHTIKGSARMLGFAAVGGLAHAVEHVLDELRHGRVALDAGLSNRLLAGADLLLALANSATEGAPPPDGVEPLLAELSALVRGPAAAPPPPPPAAEPAPASPAPSPAPAAPPARQGGRQTVRVRVDRLDRMLNLAGEMVVGRQVLTDHGEHLRSLHDLAERQLRALKALEDELARLRFSPIQRQALDGRLSTLRSTIDQGYDRLQQQADRFERHTGQLNLLIKDLEHEVMAARLLPIATVYAGLPRAVRDIAQATGKQVQLDLRGETTELDRKVLELINDPLLHLVRNAIDHGIEPPEARVAAGKPAAGRLEISAEAVGGEVRLTISDDGRGVNLARVRERALRQGLISAERANLLTPAETFELLFQPGLSTAELITEISGRGVGLDVVRTNIAELGGRVQIESQAGAGTQIGLILPLTLVTTRVLLVQAGSASYALPASGCQGIIWVHRRDLRTIEGQPTIAYGGGTIAVRSLSEALGLPPARPLARSERAPAVLIGGLQRRIALLVDALLDEREVVVKPLSPLLAGQRLWGGAVQLGDGSLVLLINPMALMHHAALASASAPIAQPRRQRHLLVVDDSFTTRELIRSVLQSAGFTVAVAVDGADALDKLQSRPYDLVVSDVEMPRLDGFQLTRNIRAHHALRDLPVILITSLASEAHRRRGLEAGAQAYIVKSQFDQESLLEVVRQLLDAHPDPHTDRAM